MVKTMQEVLPQKEALFPEMDRMESSALIGKEFVLKEAHELEGKHGSFFVCKIEVEGKDFSTAIGSKVVNERIKAVMDKLPVLTTMVEKKSKEGRVYFDLE